jgi:exodeoxyribonuclease VII large subunit
MTKKNKGFSFFDQDDEFLENQEELEANNISYEELDWSKNNILSFNFLPPHKSEKPYTVSEINEGISKIIESGNTLVWVEGEISNFSRAASGHCYFKLKDENSQIPAVMWKQNALKLKFNPQDGMKVVSIATIQVYTRGGYYQLVIQKMQPSGKGALYEAFLALKEKLEKEGLFDPSRKKPLPETISTIGIITSKYGAALFDMIKIIRKRSPKTNIVFMDVAVQGDKAPFQIANAIKDMNEYGKIDCIIVGRGGGSIEDLWAFNEEIVARAIASSKIPIISAVGHEIDFTIADFVADVRAPTPSAAAEIATKDEIEIKRYFYILAKKFYNAFNRYYQETLSSFDFITQRMAWRIPKEIITDIRQNFTDLKKRQIRAISQIFEKATSRLSYLSSRLNALNPHAIMERGYSVVVSEKGLTIKNADEISYGELLKIYFHKGKASAKVINKSISCGDFKQNDKE